MRRLIFLNRYFFPDHSATSQLLGDLAFHLAKTGKNIHVITSRQRYSHSQADLPTAEIIDGVHIHRVASTHFGRAQLIGRAVDYLSFYFFARIALNRLIEKGDIVIAKTDPPLLSIVTAHVATRRRAHLINWLQDLYPEVAIGLGVPFLKGVVGRILIRLRNYSLHAAVANVAVGERMASMIRAQGISQSRVYVIANWSNDDEIIHVVSAKNPLRAAWGLADKFVVGYSGNLGRAHDIDTIIDAADCLRDSSKIAFLFIGGGYSFNELERLAKERKIGHLFYFRPYQDREALKFSLGAADVHLLSLKPELEGKIVPSKFYGIAAAGRPILAVIAQNGEFAPLITRHRCGLIIEPGNPDALAKAIDELSQDKVRVDEMGANARGMLEQSFTRRKAFERWDELLNKVEYEIGERPQAQDFQV